MASYFWVGGTGNWDGTTNHFATTSGGTATVAATTSADDVTFDGSSGGGTVTITAASVSVLSWTSGAHTGTINTNGKTVTVAATMTISGVATRTITLGASAISCATWTALPTTGLTFNANTSTITMNGAAAIIQGGGLTYNNVSITGSGAPLINGANTFSNLTRTGTAAKADGLTFTSNVTISGTLTLNGNSVINRLLVQSLTTGTAQTLTVSTTVTASNVDFMDITGAGAASWNLSAITGKSGDCGGNSGITFTTAATQTWSGTSGGNWSTNAWTSRVPLPQDNVTISSAFSATQTVTNDMPRLGKSINWTGATGNPLWSAGASVAQTIFGGVTLATGMTTAGSVITTFGGRSANTFTSNGVTWASLISIVAPGGTIQLQDNFITSNTFTLSNGTFDANGKTFQAASLTSTGAGIRTISMGAGAWTLTRTGGFPAWNTASTGLTLTVSTATVTCTGTSGINTITTGGVTMPNLTVNGAGGTVQFLDAFTTGGTIVLTAGTLDTNGQTVTVTGAINISGSSTRTLTLGASAISCGTWTATTTTGLTLNANTSTITMNGAGTTFNGGGKTYATVSLTGSGTPVIAGANTFTTLTRTGTAITTDGLTVSANQTISGTLTLSGNSATNRLFVATDAPGTARTLTAATVSASNLGLMDITGAGTGSWNLAAITGLSGDCGGNSGITFTTPTTQTWSGTSGGNWSTNAWTTHVPLPQDSAKIASAFSASQTISGDMPRIGSLDWTGTTGAPTWNPSLPISIFGSLTMAASIIMVGTNSLSFLGRSSNTLTSVGVTFTQTIIMNGPGGTLTLADAFTTSISGAVFNFALLLSTGTLTANSNVSITGVASNFWMSAGTLNMGTGTWTLGNTAAGSWNILGGTVNASTSTIVFSTASTSSRGFVGAGHTYGTLTYTVAGSTGALTIDGGNTFANINFSDASNARTLTFTSSTTTIITGNFNVNGSSGNLMTINSSSSGTAATLSKSSGDISCDYLSIQDSHATGGANWFAGAHSTNVSGNTGWIFNAAGRWWVGGTNSWNATAGTKWATTSGGTGGAAVPVSSTDVFFDASSTGTATIAFLTTVACRSLDCTGFTGTLAFATASSQVNVGDALGGAVKFVAGMTITASSGGIINFVATTASTTYTLTTAGKALPSVYVNTGPTTTIQFADNVTCTALNLITGIWDMNSMTVIANNMLTNGTTARTLTLGAATITLSQVGTSGFKAWNMPTITGLTVTANTATVTLTGINAVFESNTINYNGMGLVFSGAGTSTITADGAFTLANLTRTGTAVQTDGLSINGAFSVTGTVAFNGNSVTNRLIVSSATPGTTSTITCNTTISASNVDFMDITGAGTASWDLHAITGLSGDCGGNSGITFTTSATQTATGTAGFTWSTHGWTSRVPLPQDDVVINNAFLASQTITADMPRLGRSIDFSGVTGSPTWSTSGAGNSIFGSLILVAGVTPSGAALLNFSGRSSYVITSAGATFPQAIVIVAPSGSYTLTDAFTCSSTATFFGSIGLSLVMNTGTLTANSNVTLTGSSGGFYMNGGTLNLGAGAWSLGATYAGTIWYVTGGTVNASTSTIVISTASTNTRAFTGGGNTYNILTYTVAGSTGQLTMTDGNTIGTLNFSDASNARTLQFTAATTTTILNAFNVRGTNGNLVTINSSTPGTQATLTKAGGVIADDYLSLRDSAATGGATWYAGAHSTNVSNNSGWIFSGPPGFLPFF